MGNLDETKLSVYDGNLETLLIKCDNNSAKNLIKNQVLFSWMKHIEVTHRCIKDHIEKREWIIVFVNSSNQLADIIREPLAKKIFFFVRIELRILNQSCIE